MAGLWIKVGTGFYRTEQQRQLGISAQMLHIRGMALCRENMTDGIVKEWQLPLIAFDMPDVGDLVRRLTQAGPEGEAPVWTAIDGGWTIPEYLERNMTAAELKALSEKRSKAGKASAANRSVEHPVEHPVEQDVEQDVEHNLNIATTTLLYSVPAVQNTNGTDVHLPQAKPDGAEWEPDDPAYTPIAGYDGKSELALWEKTWGKISPSQVTMAQNSLIRLHVYFKLSVQQVRRLVEHVNTDPEAGEWWGGKQRSPSSWLQQDESGQHRWQKIRTHAESSTKPKPPKGDGDIRPTPTPFREILNR